MTWHNNPQIIFYPFADGAALHLAGSHRIWVLNASSAALWCLLQEHGDSDGLTRAYAQHFQISPAQAQLDVRKGLEGFGESGLSGARPPAPPVDSSQLPVTRRPSLESGNLSIRLVCRLGPTSWQISCPDCAAAAAALTSFAHLASDCSCPALTLDLVEADNGLDLYRNGALLKTGLAAEQWFPRLMAELFEELCSELDHRLLLHAAVLVRDGAALLLPAEAGSGKSTLSLALATAGWQVYSDELAPLDPKALVIDPFPLPVGIKSRSVPVLTPLYPELAKHPVFLRADGQQVRYLGRDDLPLAAAGEPPVPIERLVFPAFHPEGPTRLTRLGPLQALELLVRTGSSQRPLTEADVRALLALAEQRECYRLEYREVAEAVSRLKRLTMDRNRPLRANPGL